jgi:hypothetical protein
MTGAAHRGLLVLALVTRWNTSCCGTEPKAKAKKAPAMAHQAAASMSAGNMTSLPSAAAWEMTLPAAASHVADQDRHQGQADQDDHRLEQVGEGHRPHAAEDGVDQHHRGADHDGGVEVQRAAGQRGDDQAQGGHLRRGPAQVGQHDGQAGQHLHALP